MGLSSSGRFGERGFADVGGWREQEQGNGGEEGGRGKERSETAGRSWRGWKCKFLFREFWEEKAGYRMFSTPSEVRATEEGWGFL